MWMVFEEIERNVTLTSKKGAKYTANIVRGVKKGYMDDPDTEYEKTVFDNTYTTVVDRRGEVEMDITEFFEACEPGDLIVVTNEKDGQHWRISQLENKNRSVVSDSDLPIAAPAPAVGGGDPWCAASCGCAWEERPRINAPMSAGYLLNPRPTARESNNAVGLRGKDPPPNS